MPPSIDQHFIQAQIAALQEQVREMRKPLDPGGTGPHDPGMEARVARLETDVTEIKGDVKRLAIDVAEIKGALSRLPTTVQMVGLMFSMFAGTVAIFGAVFAFIRYVMHL